MNRLTARTTNGHAYYPECFKPPCNGDGCKKELCEFSVEVCSRLADYEDTGLTPEQIRQIDELYAEKCRELAEERKKHEWIPCSERMPEEHKSIFAKFKGTSKWRDAMFEKDSDRVIALVQFNDGTMKSMQAYTIDGKWKPDTVVECKVIAWMPLPSTYSPEEIK